jgi:riboflavin kinase/FMN adenylyltransferase
VRPKATILDRTLRAADLNPRPRIVTIGSFDGVHRGHAVLLRQAVERAAVLDVKSLAVTFEPLPQMVLRPDRFTGRICAPEEKLDQLVASDVDQVLIITFDHELSQQSPETFMRWLQESTGLRELWVGEAFALGKNRAGDVERLTEIGAELGFGVIAVPRLTDGDAVISSSAIRDAIASGEVDRACRLLGRPFRVAGEVVHGAHLGRAIGYPTANVAPPAALVTLADGIYVSRAELPSGGASRESMTYVGTRPTVNGGPRYIETHLLDFEGDLYGQTLGVEILHRLRGDETFESLDALIAQLQRDEEAARAYFKASQSQEVEQIN